VEIDMKKAVLLAVTLMLVASATPALAVVVPVDGTYYFTGEPNDQANKTSTPTGSFQKNAPEGPTPITQTGSPTCNADIPADPQCIFWEGKYTGDIYGNMEFCWYWSSTNAEAAALGLEVQITVFADPGKALVPEPENIIGRGNSRLAAPTAQPQQYASSIYVQGTVEENMLVQVEPVYADTGPGNTVYYGSPEFPSSFGPEGTACKEPKPLSPRATLGFKDTTPERGASVRARAGLRTCNKQTKGTKIQLQKKVNGVFKPVDTNTLGADCRTTFRVEAKFRKATFRSFWPKQSPKYKAGRSREQTVRTHR
jgi:hypothetical protein